VHRRLRADILAGALAPGSRLLFADLGDRYRASMGVLREALTRLAGEGLVDSAPQSGHRVMSLSAADLVDLTEARVHLELPAISLAIRHGDLDWEAALVATLHRLARTAAEPHSAAWSIAHAAMHDALFAGCPNPRLRALVAGLRDAGSVYRHWSLTLPSGPPRDLNREYAAICDAALARDPAAARRAVADHLITTAELLVGPDHDRLRCLRPTA
jgi:DNA-binding GntR family transcriptional regulator